MDAERLSVLRTGSVSLDEDPGYSCLSKIGSIIQPSVL